MSKNYTLLRHDLIRDNKLNSRATILLAVLVSYYNKDLGHAYPSYEVLLKNTGINKRTLIKELKFLEDNGYIRIENGEGRGRNKYYISSHCLV
jgi:hypothetical protein